MQIEGYMRRHVNTIRRETNLSEKLVSRLCTPRQTQQMPTRIDCLPVLAIAIRGDKRFHDKLIENDYDGWEICV